MASRTIPELAREAEQLLVPIARAGADPITYSELANMLTPEGERPVPARQLGKVLLELRERVRTRSWTPFLTAFVVNADTGEPGQGYYVTGVGDAAAVREKTHERLATGIYEAS